ncbi:adenine deaminase [Candidatus Bipolaricaulota bacterium]|nr:adenine deaminase [Candidatus Bipolaricaulota bacterium]
MQEAPVDILLQGGSVLDVFTGQFRRADLAIAHGVVTGFAAVEARQTIDVSGRFLIPGLIDTHVHLESAQLAPPQFARAVLPHGTTTVIADPHEIANVLGMEGVRWILDAARTIPLEVFVMLPACVPATPLETSGDELSSEQIARMLSWPGVLGLGEVMNFPAVMDGDREMLRKLGAARGRPIDGHFPSASGPRLWSYIISGPKTDHESVTLEEAREKLTAGMHVLIREGTVARNAAALAPLLTAETAPFVHLCTDDRHPETLLREGHIDDVLRKVIAHGPRSAPEVAICAATVHAAQAYGLHDRGALAPGYRADIAVLSDVRSVEVESTFIGGIEVARSGTCVVEMNDPLPSLKDHPLLVSDHQAFDIPIPAASSGTVRTIGVRPDQVLTDDILAQARVVSEDGSTLAESDPQSDLLKLAVLERHRGTGNVGVGFVRGFGLQRGALASTVAHDSHNIIVVGADDDSMRAAVRALVRCGGGQVVVRRNELLAQLALPIAGLMSRLPVEEVTRLQEDLNAAARELGCTLPAPFMTLSFLALPVIPTLRLTDLGLVDVLQFEIVSVVA